MDTTGLDIVDLKPCYLLGTEISRHGGEQYSRKNEHRVEREDGSVYSEWETQKTLSNEDEFKEATQLVGKCKREIHKLGRSLGNLGLIVPRERIDDVRAFRDEWREKFAEFNGRAKHSKLRFRLVIVSTAGENAEVLKDLLEDLRDGLSDLEAAYKSADPKSMRDVVQRMSGFSDLLPERVALSIENAIKATRKRASDISRAEKLSQRVQAKINQELGPDGDVEKELQTLAQAPLTTDVRNQTRKLARLAGDAQKAADKLERARERVDETPIRLARFAAKRRERSEVDDQQAGDLNAARAAARVARVNRSAQAPAQESN